MSEEIKPKKIRRLNLREKVFVKELIKNGGNQTAASKVAYPTTKDAPQNGHRLATRPAVKMAINEYLDSLYPDHGKEFVGLFKKAIEMANREGVTIKELLETLKTLSEISGMRAPKETHNKSLKATVSFPGMEKKES